MDEKKHEKVIRGLEKCTECLGHCSDECPYYSHSSSCSGVQLRRVALVLLKEQEERIKFLEKWTAYLEGGDPYEGMGVLSHD